MCELETDKSIKTLWRLVSSEEAIRLAWHGMEDDVIQTLGAVKVSLAGIRRSLDRGREINPEIVHRGEDSLSTASQAAVVYREIIRRAGTECILLVPIDVERSRGYAHRGGGWQMIDVDAYWQTLKFEREMGERRVERARQERQLQAA